MNDRITDLFVRFAALWLVWATAAFGAELDVEGARLTEADGVATVTLRPAPIEGAELWVADAAGQRAVRATAQPLPTDLWILVDSSALCQAQKADAYVNRLVQALRRQASPETLVTLVSYTSEAIDVLLRRKPVSAMTDPKIECESRPLSASYDRPLAALLRELKPTALPTTTWIFTSGNIDLSKETAKAIAGRNLEMHLVLYNEFVQKDILPAWQATQASLRGQRTSFGVLPKADAGVHFPAMSYRVEFPVAAPWRGTFAALQFGARAPGAAASFAKRELSVDIPLSAFSRFWKRWGTLILSLLAALLVAYTGYRLVRYYRPRRCPQCRRRIAFPVGACLFCRDLAFLVGVFRRTADGFGDTGTTPGSATVVPVGETHTELGTHRTSPVRFAPRGRKRCYVRLVREARDIGAAAYRLERAPLASGIDVRVNGRPLDGERYLASGDELLIDTTRLTFFVGGNHG